MQINEIRNLSDAQLLNEIDDNRQELFRLRFQQSSGELKDTSLFRQNRRVYARLKMVLEERQAQAEESKGKNNG